MRHITLLIGLLIAQAQAHALVPRFKGGQAVRVALSGGREAGIGLRSRGHAWQLDVNGARAAQADVYDVTAGAAHTRFRVAIAAHGAITLDDDRFVPGHAYRVQLDNASALIYLYPPVAPRQSRLVFEDDAAPARSDELRIVPKGEL